MNGNITHENRFLLQKQNFDPTKHTRYTVFTAQSVLHRITILNNTLVINIIIKAKIILILYWVIITG